ncbi:MAG: ACP S-malonyltransferase [Legionella sp.]|uniref:ACP S-malonyltransferase n=1 Tax=Legionella sp. TaxID=459 RepID=UPI00283F4678|nr:ACP S-malonyltransferase [Legionella sp.]
MVKTAFVFPGQGSQSVGMLADFELQYPIIVDTFAEASEAVGYDLWHLVQQGPAERLNQTEYTQVAMLTADVAVYRLLEQENLATPEFMAGHSLGEYPALVCAGALTLTEGARLVAHRGQVMQQAVPLGVGAMAAIIGFDDEQVKLLCQEASQEYELVTPANYNSPEQIVVAGHTAAVNRMIALAEDAGARLAKIIPVSVPCHCPLLTDAAASFAAYLAEVNFKKPNIKVVSNVDLSIYESAEQIKDRLKEQLYSPVRWVETIQLFKNHGVELILECGPGKVLNGLIKRIDRSLNTISMYDTISLEQVAEQLAEQLA